MSIIKILNEQETFGFTGRINILDRGNAQFLGVIFQEDGLIVNARFLDFRGKKALYKLTIDDLGGQNAYRYVVEPELIEDADRAFELKVKDFEKHAKEFFEKVEKSRKLKPPGHLKVILNSEFIIKGATVDTNEFSVMCTVSDYATVADIYKNSSLFEFEITTCLVSLREKGALRVVRA